MFKKDLSKAAIEKVDKEVAEKIPFGPLCWIKKVGEDRWEIYSQNVSWHPWKERHYEPVLHDVLGDREAEFLISLQKRGEEIMEKKRKEEEAKKEKDEEEKQKWIAAWEERQHPNLEIVGTSRIEIVDDMGNFIDILPQSWSPENTSDQDIENKLLDALQFIE